MACQMMQVVWKRPYSYFTHCRCKARSAAGFNSKQTRRRSTSVPRGRYELPCLSGNHHTYTHMILSRGHSYPHQTAITKNTAEMGQSGAFSMTNLLPPVLYHILLYYTLLYSTLLYSTILYYTILYYTILYYTILYYTILYYTILYYTILY